MTEQLVRHTVDTITDNDLDQLYTERDEARAAADRYFTNGTKAVEELHWRAHNAEQSAEQAEAERDKACTAFNAKIMELEKAKREQLGDREAISYWTHQARVARDFSAYDGRARAATIVQARRQAARAEQAETANARVTSPEAIRAAAMAIGDAALTLLGRDLGTIHIETIAEAALRAALDESKEPRP